jgi:hypothetical protein
MGRFDDTEKKLADYVANYGRWPREQREKVETELLAELPATMPFAAGRRSMEEWPEGPPWYEEEQTKQWQQQLFEQKMTRCQNAWQAGVSLAVSDAIWWCRFHQCPPPEWLDIAVATVVNQRRSKAEAKRHLDDMAHYARWDLVKELREQKPFGPLSWDDCYEKVAMLERTEDTASGGSDAVKRSYILVENDMRKGRGGKYFTPERRVRVVRRKQSKPG